MMIMLLLAMMMMMMINSCPCYGSSSCCDCLHTWSISCAFSSCFRAKLGSSLCEIFRAWKAEEGPLAKAWADSKLGSPRFSGSGGLGAMSASECWLHGVHLPPGASWPRAFSGDFKACSPDFLTESAERLGSC